MTEAIKGWWESLHFYAQLAVKGVVVAGAVLLLGFSASAFWDAFDGTIDRQWKPILKFALVLWPFMSAGLAAAFWSISIKGLSAEQLELLRKLRKGEV